MQWRFWRASGRKNTDEAPPEQSRANAAAWPASAGAKEILGLQQLVGNQAVLRMLMMNPGDVETPVVPGSKKQDPRVSNRGM
jgi:hypothetical protein